MNFNSKDARLWLEAEVLPDYLRASRWFGGKARELTGVRIAEVLPFPGDACISLVATSDGSGESALYQLPLVHGSRAQLEALIAENPSAIIAEHGDNVLLDALFAPGFRAELWRRLTSSTGPAPSSRVLRAEQSNSSLLFEEKVFVKLFRRLQTGVNPDAEILRFLTEERHFAHVPSFVGALEWPVAPGHSALLAIAITAVPNRSDAWTYALTQLRQAYTRALDRPAEDEQPNCALVNDAFLGRIAQLGTRTGELHIALAGSTTNPDFAPEPLATADFTALQQNVLHLWDEIISAAPPEHATRLHARTPIVRQRAMELTSHPIHAMKTRTHGDYHLGQVLDTGTDFVIIDFEGEPARPLNERRRKQSPIRDVAGMLRSLHYAAHAALTDDSPSALREAESCIEVASRIFLDAWKHATVGASFRPEAESDLTFLLEAFLFEKVIYEIHYELNNRPAWLHIPERGLQRILGTSSMPD